jgi:diaminohydroxyphosphoribosylaminopyrimidine deaminase/5-amino-6-(5-phosphoribosylamino)uracil reductase
VHTDDFYMDRALAAAERGRGRTSPNPMVGAVIVDTEGVVVGAGSHEFAGGPHAEVHALQAAGERAQGATLYCTLEPCSHVGRTGPCAPLVARSGIARVVIATEDPNPLVNGGGITLLRAHDISVTTGVRRDAAQALNQPFFTRIMRGRPFVTMKVALSRDGRISERAGARTPLTGAAANRLIHRERAEIDALAVGSGTALADDPLLTARGAYRHRPLTRVMFDTRLRTPPGARVLSTLAAGPVIIISTPSAAAAAPERLAALRAAGADVELVEPGAGTAGRAEMLQSALERLAARGVSSVTVEGGAMLHRAFWDSGLVDRVQMFRTPHVLGPTGVQWLPSVAAGAGLREVTTRTAGPDLLIEAYVYRPD